VVLDLIISADSATEEESMLAGSSKALASAGAPFRSTYVPEDSTARLRQRGFADIVMMSFQDRLRRNAGRLGGDYVKKRGEHVGRCTIIIDRVSAPAR
jgi:hypothetical protein